jgi:cytochrome c-type biogenesis protein CcmH/NrfG
VENPTSAAAWADLGNAYFDSNQPLEAVQAYEHSLELDPMNAMVWTDLGVMQRRSGRPEKAVEAFDRASRLDPKLEQPRFNKGIVLLHDLSDRAGAVQAWEELLAMNPAAVTPMGGPLRDMVEEIKRGGQ